jgi:TRAP-type C4-dicarboxylate transport system substrate-binding protein
MKNSYKCAVMALIFSALSTTVQAKTTLKVAATVPVGTPWADHLIEWKENVESASGGEIELEFFLGGQLGNEYDVYRQVQRGRIDIGWFTGAVMAENVPEIALMSTPFFFRESKTLDCVYGGKFGDQLATYVSEDGVKMLQWQETGWVSIIAKDDLSDVEAAKGYKARVAPQPMSRTLWSSVGANVSEIPYMEMPSALQTNLIKSGETAAISYFAFGLDKVAPHYIRTRHLH